MRLQLSSFTDNNIGLVDFTTHPKTYMYIVVIGTVIIIWERYGLTWKNDNQAGNGKILVNVHQRYIVRLLHIILRCTLWLLARQAIWLSPSILWYDRIVPHKALGSCTTRSIRWSDQIRHQVNITKVQSKQILLSKHLLLSNSIVVVRFFIHEMLYSIVSRINCNASLRIWDWTSSYVLYWELPVLYNFPPRNCWSCLLLWRHGPSVIWIDSIHIQTT